MRLIQNLKIKCKKCDTIFKVKDEENHLENECENVIVECSVEVKFVYLDTFNLN